jgi:uncharacterized protein YegP (UPF0339 family)
MCKVVRSLLAPLALAAAVGAFALDAANAQVKKDKDKKSAEAATAVFELYKDTADEFRFRLKTGDGVLLATSGKGYKTKTDCQKVIDIIKNTAGRAKVEEIAKK